MIQKPYVNMAKLYQRALRKLRDAHYEEYRAYVEEERQAAGFPPRASRAKFELLPGERPVRRTVSRLHRTKKGLMTQEHGTLGGYRAGCGCNECMDAEALYARRKKERRNA